MSLSGNVASFGWEQLLSLLAESELDGTLRIEGANATLDVLFQGGLVVVPIPVHPELGQSRKHDCKLANRVLSEALSWRFASFVFKPDEVPPGFMARRAIVLKPKKLVEAVDLLRFRRKAKPSSAFARLERAPLKGDVAKFRLAPLVRSLKKHRRTGTLQVVSGDQRIAIDFKDGCAYIGSEAEFPGSPVRNQILAACGWREGGFRFTPGVFSDVGSRPGDSKQREKTQRILMQALSDSNVEEPKAEAKTPRPPARRLRRRSRAKRSRRGRSSRYF